MLLLCPWSDYSAHACCRDHAPSIIFMDEVDSIGSARSESGGGGGGDSEVQRTMLELLNQLDGFAATNKIKVGQRAPLRPFPPTILFLLLYQSQSGCKRSMLEARSLNARPIDRLNS